MLYKNLFPDELQILLFGFSLLYSKLSYFYAVRLAGLGHLACLVEGDADEIITRNRHHQTGQALLPACCCYMSTTDIYIIASLLTDQASESEIFCRVEDSCVDNPAMFLFQDQNRISHCDLARHQPLLMPSAASPSWTIFCRPSHLGRRPGAVIPDIRCALSVRSVLRCHDVRARLPILGRRCSSTGRLLKLSLL